ncbi:MAG: DNA methyltransferase [Victivallales bacterium]
MPLNWTEIKQRAILFSREWATETREEAEAQSFWNEFFEVFGVRRRTVATFEEPVHNLGGQYGYIDLFWRGKLLVEHKSLGKNLGAAESQAFQYIQNLASEGRHDEIPRYVIVSDFANIALHDLEPEEQLNLPLFSGRRISTISFPLSELHKHVRNFSFIAGYTQHRLDPDDPANIRAAEIMGSLHDALLAGGYSGHALERLLVRILFCLFAEDTGIFAPNAFSGYIDKNTRPDGTDLGVHLARIFQVLDTPNDKRQASLDEDLANLSYVNGALFAESLPFAEFNRNMRDALIACTRFDWSRISPAIFGSLFQSVMDPDRRRNIGAHYTSEKNIMKLIKPLFLDELQGEFEEIKNVKTRLRAFHEKIASLKFFDPACGCGNFLVITYREMRLLEIKILKILNKDGTFLDVASLSKIDVDSFYGIEIEEFPARIAEVAMWLMDHQMNIKLSEEFGMYYVRLPLRKSANITNANALYVDWNHLIHGSYFDVSADVVNVGIAREPLAHYKTINVVAKKLNVVDEKEIQRQQDRHGSKFDYIFGNPPFIGKQHRNESQNSDMEMIFNSEKGYGVLDYVTCWHVKAAQYIQGTKTKVAFVSTNSISQGEQVGILWNMLFKNYNIKIHFAHRAFSWNNEARGMAHVYVVIVGFSNHETQVKRLFEYDSPKSEPHEVRVRNINPYLVEGDDVVILKKNRPLCSVPEINFGNMPNDGGNLLLDDNEKKELLKNEPGAKEFVKPLLSAKEWLNGGKKWCLWLKDIAPSQLKAMPEVSSRVEKVRQHREASDRKTTRELADYPTLFGEIRQPKAKYVLVLRHTSENRKYVPFGFFSSDYIVHDSCACIPDATLYHFGVLSSEMHMTWMRYVCGRIKGDFRYSNDIVYNNFPWPENPPDNNKKAVEGAVQNILDVRKEFSSSSLADLYDPLSMPPYLVKAHKDLDKAVDLCYRPQAFVDEMKRMEYLFILYRNYTDPLMKKKK